MCAFFKTFFYSSWRESLDKQMANPILNTCCRCQSLRNGSIIAGVCAILLSIVSIVITFTVRVTYKTIFFDWLPPWIVKIIIGFNLCMTILISAIMIVGAMKVQFSYLLYLEMLKIKIKFKQFHSFSEITIWCCHGSFWDAYWLLGYSFQSFTLASCLSLTASS